MGIGNILALSQVTGYALSIILFFFVVWPMSMCLVNFKGNCILFSSGVYHHNVEPPEFVVTFWAPGACCAFVIFLSLIVMVISIWQAIRLSLHLIKNTDSSFIGVFLTCISNMLIFILLLATAPSVTAGFKIWCGSIEKSQSYTCAMADYVMHWQDSQLKPNIFYLQITVVEFGLYSMMLTWLVECFFSGYKLLVYHRQEHLFRSLSRERQRLLGDYEPVF